MSNTLFCMAAVEAELVLKVKDRLGLAGPAGYTILQVGKVGLQDPVGLALLMVLVLDLGLLALHGCPLETHLEHTSKLVQTPEDLLAMALFVSSGVLGVPILLTQRTFNR